MIKHALLSTSLLSLVLGAGFAVAQQGTRPDPMAGQSASTPGASPTDTPQAKQNQSPAANTQSTTPDNAGSQTTQAQPPSDNAPKQSAPETPKADNPQTASNVELTAPVTGSPQTKIIDSSAVGKHDGLTGAPDPLLETPPLPKGNPTLIGGTATKVDRIRSRVTVEPFGAKNKMTIAIDERTHIYRNGVETTIEHIKKGDRVYFDSMLDGPKVFAKNVRVLSEAGAAEVRGQITAYDPSRGMIQLQDALSSRPVSFRITNRTHVTAQQGSASTGDLAKGALVDVVFAPDKANRGIATQIVVLARPGVSYTFAGTITNVNMRDGIVSVENESDGKVYDIAFDARSKSERNSLHVGNSVSIAATFDSENYKATNITVTEASSKPKPRPDQKQPKPDDQE